MTRIPIDLAAPIACTASGGELSARIGQIERMRSELRSVDRTEVGLLLRFDPGVDLEADLHAFARTEKGCCQFWGFEVEAGSALALRWDGPPAAQAVLDGLHRYFTGDDDLTALSGLL